MDKLISIDFSADFGFFRKPDTNEGVALSYNMLHKPALLGILGAIAGYAGYQRRGELPEYYQELKDLKIGIKPLNHQKGNFSKTVVWYTNTVGYANKDGNFLAQENMLIKPSYRVFLMLAESHVLFSNLKKGEAEYLPYFGKNEFPIWWNNYQEYPIDEFQFSEDYQLDTIFLKKGSVSDIEKKELADPFNLSSFSPDSFFYFERLPVGFWEFETKRGKEYQYELSEFAYTNAKLSREFKLKNLLRVNTDKIIQLF